MTTNDSAPHTDSEKSPGDMMDMRAAVEMLRTTRSTFYRWLRTGKIKGTKVGRQWRFRREDIERFMAGEGPRIDLPADISPLVEILRARLADLGADPGAGAEDDGLVHAVNLMIRLGSALGASDIHLEAHVREGQPERAALLRCRVDGALRVLAEFDARLLPAVIQRWKAMAACDLRETGRAQDGRFSVDVTSRRCWRSRRRSPRRLVTRHPMTSCPWPRRTGRGCARR